MFQLKSWIPMIFEIHDFPIFYLIIGYTGYKTSKILNYSKNEDLTKIIQCLSSNFNDSQWYTKFQN